MSATYVARPSRGGWKVKRSGQPWTHGVAAESAEEAVKNFRAARDAAAQLEREARLTVEGLTAAWEKIAGRGGE